MSPNDEPAAAAAGLHQVQAIMSAPEDVRLTPEMENEQRGRTPLRDAEGGLYSGFRHDAIDLVRDKKGRPVWCQATAISVLKDHPAWAEVLAFDEHQGIYLLTQPPPGESAPAFAPRELTDHDIVHVVAWLNRNGFPMASRAVTAEAAYAVAAMNIINPLRHWLEDLRWDGRPRINSWLAEYLGSEESDYAAEVGRRWLISGVARVKQPGCKAEGVVILEGPQGVGKSTALRILASEEYFGDALPDISGKDAQLYLRGKWIVELAELNTLSRAGFEAQKAFISRQEERYRQPYGRTEVNEPRRCVFAGTTNRSDYLRDPSGNRRFWPVRVGPIDLVGLKRDREQLWAEARAAFDVGERWWLGPEAESSAFQVQAERNADDPWRAAVESFVSGRQSVACKTILTEAINVPLSMQGRAESLRVAGILAELGWQREGQFTSGPDKGLARYLPARDSR